jgi:hypothetical protein
MNLKPQDNPTPDPDVSIDEALLDEALAEPTPEALEAKILALTDPHTLSLLDEALAPEPASDALTQRILAATASMGVETPPPPAIAGRIGPATFRYAAAAAVALIACLSVYFVLQGPNPSDTTVAIDPSTAGDTAAEPVDWFADEQLASADALFESETEPIEDALSDLSDSVEGVTINRDTLWAELDAYEDFLDEIES